MKPGWIRVGFVLAFIFVCGGSACPMTGPMTPGRDPLPPTKASGLPESSARFQKTNLTFFIANFTSKISQDKQVQFTTDAFGRWSAVTPLNFSRTMTRAGADFVVGYGTGGHCELYVDSSLTCSMDAAFEASTLGHAYFPDGPNSGHCHMNDAHNWADERLLFSTLVHELGHALGLPHLPDNSAVMFASDNGQTGNLTQADITAVHKLYGSRDGTVKPEPRTQPPGTDANANRTVPTPTQLDTDGDGIDDATEIFVYGTNPNMADSDGDGVDDGIECVNLLDPRNSDTDGDGASDGDEFNGDGNAFRPDNGLSGDVTPFVGKYTGEDSIGSPIEFTIAADGGVTGTLSLTKYGFEEDYELIGAAGSTGQVILVSYDYFFEYKGTITGSTVGSGVYTTDAGSNGTWTATKMPGKLKLPDAGARAFRFVDDGSGGQALSPLRRPDIALYVPDRP